jgi:signal transduction histidine kinase
MSIFKRPVNGSIAGNLALHLGIFGALIFCVTLIGSILIDAFENPSQLRNAVALNVLESAARSTASGAFVLEETTALAELRQSGSEFWFVISDGKALVEHNSPARPVLPVDIRIDGPSLSANFSAGDRSTAIRTVEIAGFEGRIVLATTGSHPSLLRVIQYYLQISGIKILLGGGALALLISTTVALAIRQITRTIRGMVRAAAEIAPDNPKGALSSSHVPSELHPLTRALDGALDRIAASMEQQRRFISNAAHELRTPLAILRVKIESVQDQKVRSVLVSDLQRLTTLVAAMLDLARMKANVSGLRMQSLDLVVLSREVLGEQAPTIIDRGMEAALEVPDGAVVVRGNETVLRSAISNLIANAVSHARTATILTVRVTSDGALEVVDNGVGIPEAHRDEVLEPFARLAPASDGTGLGLSIVREIMLAHGGSIGVSETLNGGLTVRLSFARMPSPSAAI